MGQHVAQLQFEPMIDNLDNIMLWMNLLLLKI